MKAGIDEQQREHTQAADHDSGGIEIEQRRVGDEVDATRRTGRQTARVSTRLDEADDLVERDAVERPIGI